jgi:dihydroorotase
MITIKNVKTLEGQIIEKRLDSHLDQIIDGEGRLLLFPALIDPHVSLGSPNAENWAFAVESVVRGGFGRILNIPAQQESVRTKEDFEKDKLRVDQLLKGLKIPLGYFPYVKANSELLDALGMIKNLTMGSLLIFKPEDHLLDSRIWDRIFQIAAWEDLPVIINSQNENSWEQARFKGSGESLIEKAIHYAEKLNARLYVMNVSSRDEIELIQEGRGRSLLIYAETTPEHLFPFNSQADFLWEALSSGVIETLGSGYSVESQEEARFLWEGGNFESNNPLFFLPRLLTAFHERKITLENILRVTSLNFYDIFKIERKTEDFILLDLEKESLVQKISKGQSTDIKLRGWPEYICLQGHLFKSGAGGYRLTPCG